MIGAKMDVLILFSNIFLHVFSSSIMLQLKL